MRPERTLPGDSDGFPDPAILLPGGDFNLPTAGHGGLGEVGGSGVGRHHVGLLFNFNVHALAAGGWKRVLRRR
jgi:hypothetical protein